MNVGKTSFQQKRINFFILLKLFYSHEVQIKKKYYLNAIFTMNLFLYNL